MVVPAAIAVFLAGCDPAQEFPATGGPSPSAPSAGRLFIEGPRSLLTGESATYRARYTGPDGRTVDVTNYVHWRSSDPSLLVVDQNGMANGLGAGTMTLRSVYQRLSSLPLTINVGSRLAGGYTLTIGGGPCRAPGTLTSALTRRTYPVLLTQNGLALRAWISAGRFEHDANGFGGSTTASSDTARFELSGPTFGWWSESAAEHWAGVAEILPDDTRLEIIGTVQATSVPSGFAGTFSGTLTQWSHDRETVLGECESDTHPFTLVR